MGRISSSITTKKEKIPFRKKINRGGGGRGMKRFKSTVGKRQLTEALGNLNFFNNSGGEKGFKFRKRKKEHSTGEKKGNNALKKKKENPQSWR